MNGATDNTRRYLAGALVMPFALQAIFIALKMSGVSFYPGGEPSWALAGAGCGVVLLTEALTRYKAALGVVYVVVVFFLLMAFSGLFLKVFYGIESTPPFL